MRQGIGHTGVAYRPIPDFLLNRLDAAMTQLRYAAAVPATSPRSAPNVVPFQTEEAASPMRKADLPPSSARATTVQASREVIELARLKGDAAEEQIAESQRLIEASRSLIEGSRKLLEHYRDFLNISARRT
jgi:hypothetical protein